MNRSARASIPARVSSRFRNGFLKIHVDANRRRIHTPHLRGSVAASRLANNSENAKPRNSKARQWRAVQSGVNRGNFGSVARPNLPEKTPLVKRKNELSAKGGSAPISGPPAGSHEPQRSHHVQCPDQ